MAINPITRKEIFMAKAAGEKVPDITPVTREEIFLSRIAGGGGSSGGGADLLNADGVIKQEHLPEGYPYKTVEEGYFLEECQPTFVEEAGMFAITEPVPSLTAGDTYTVTWNGTEYNCVALSYTADNIEIGAALGNVGAVEGGESTGEPFALILVKPEMATEEGFYGQILPLDGSTSLTLSIKGEVATYHPISEKYLTFPKLVYANTVIDTDYSVLSCDKTYNKILGEIIAGNDVALHITVSGMEGIILVARFLQLTEGQITFFAINSASIHSVSLFSCRSDDTWETQQAT